MPPSQSEPRIESVESHEASNEVDNEFEDIRTLLAPQYDLTSDRHLSDLGGQPAGALSSEASTRRQYSVREQSDGENAEWSEWSGFSEAEDVTPDASTRPLSPYSLPGSDNRLPDNEAIPNPPKDGVQRSDGTFRPALTVKDLQKAINH